MVFENECSQFKNNVIVLFCIKNIFKYQEGNYYNTPILILQNLAFVVLIKIINTLYESVVNTIYF